ncbi:acyl-CoA carboxylase subunit beta [Hydrogenibacillus sp. N12]|uniref:acyl-CoA carboxylase subunit beta n=1 Tax=Hydrogenibacillus sp. N12 TaxID=2866627 RepID=UPI001C7D4C4F|nr:acyl-CoA carboxylase subunit beta [Hydrogenibacillus sp. N12]QZA32135.1 acyl-CoA carboxylase subunit beta [Hydrogenibacillus sp. N12]
MGERERRLIEERERIRQGGPPRGHERQRAAGKLFVRDRLRLFFDAVETETGTFARYDDPELAADGVVTGSGTIDGRPVFFIASDYTVKAGSVGIRHAQKFLATQKAALRARRPIVYLVDSSGARIDETGGHHVDPGSIGEFYYMHSLLSGAVPQIGVLYGTCFAGTAYTPVFTDLLVMMKDAAMAIASPRMVEVAIGQKVTPEALGGVEVHAKKSGSVHFVAESEEEAAALVRRILSYLPDSSDGRPPSAPPVDPARDPEEIDAILPEDPNRPYDVRRLIEAIVDAGSFLEVKAMYAPELVTGFARLGGEVIGIVANQPAVKGGTIFPESADKGAEFVWLCDAYNIPLLYLVDTPGFMVGTMVEQNAILRRGRKFIFATASATVPRVSVVVRKAYGAGIYAMSGPAFHPDVTLALPSAEIAVMGPEAAVNAVYYNKIQAIEDPEERKRLVERLRAEYRAGYDIYKLAGELVVDELIPPKELRTQLMRYFELFREKHIELPRRKHATII